MTLSFDSGCICAHICAWWWQRAKRWRERSEMELAAPDHGEVHAGREQGARGGRTRTYGHQRWEGEQSRGTSSEPPPPSQRGQRADGPGEYRELGRGEPILGSPEPWLPQQRRQPKNDACGLWGRRLAMATGCEGTRIWGTRKTASTELSP